ncbi:peptidylprolyl isomerase [Trichloromonas sp.]|uniref:peptidylprolyl isomerase n=1 Tax=Trichloromonas sp. TaxID=3069249 RepID=UPI002A4A3415|nr:peptidylprolyl isomerase [Trichloromonas sp.]
MIRRFIGACFCVLFLSTSVSAAEFALIRTSLGDIKVELNREKAPLSVANFVAYAEQGFYKETIFHRVIKDFMIQGGGFTADMQRKETLPPIKNEATNGLKNLRGTIAMARTNVIDSATSQFFINHKDNDFLDHRGVSPATYGYAVFGRVVRGLEVVDAIAGKKTGGQGLFKDIPVESVIIRDVTYLQEGR